MNKFSNSVLTFLLTGSLVLFNSCDEEPPLPDNLTEFESEQLGVTSSESEITVNIKLAREAEVDGSISVTLEPTGVAYDTDFTTDPAASANSLTIAVPALATAASFKVKKKEGVPFDGDEKVAFTISSTSESLVIGEKKTLTVTFAEIIAPSGQLEVSGGGATYGNKVFIDLSANRQTAVSRTTWDLGFSTTDDFRVILNSSNGMMARALTKTDLATVTSADTVGFGAQLSMAAVFAAINSPTAPAWLSGAASWIDDPSGDLTKTAIASVSATPADNKVYIIFRGNGPGATQPSLGWKKIRIIRNGSNYTLQHADINSTTVTEVQVVKDANYRFQYVHFSTGAVSVEPQKTKWDIAWTAFSNITNFGTGPVPYYFQDVILQNISGVQTVQVMEATTAYDAFAESHLAGVTFASSQMTIGTNWRSGGGPGTAPAVRSDRFYVIKDAEGNYYKLKFTALATNGERGKPQFKYALVKKAS